MCGMRQGLVLTAKTNEIALVSVNRRTSDYAYLQSVWHHCDSLINTDISVFGRYQWAGSVSYMYVDVYPPTATVYTVTGLKPSTVYNFSVNALNTMGESSYADNNRILMATTTGKGTLTCLIKQCFLTGGSQPYTDYVHCFQSC